MQDRAQRIKKELLRVKQNLSSQRDSIDQECFEPIDQENIARSVMLGPRGLVLP